MVDQKREEVINEIRSVLVSTKDSLDIRQMQRDYRMIVGEDIPFRKLGYNNLVAFLKSIATLRIVERNGEIYVQAKETEESRHISSLVEKQRSSKKKHFRGFHVRSSVPSSRYNVPKFKKTNHSTMYKFPGNPKLSPRRFSNYNPNRSSYQQERRRTDFDFVERKKEIHQKEKRLNKYSDNDEKRLSPSDLRHTLKQRLLPSDLRNTLNQRLEKYKKSETVQPDYQVNKTIIPDYQINKTVTPDYQIERTVMPDYQVSTTSMPDYQVSTTSMPDQINKTVMPDYQIKKTVLLNYQINEKLDSTLDEDEFVRKSYRNPSPPPPKSPEIEDLLNKISDINLNKTSVHEKENISGHTNRLSVILKQVADLKSKQTQLASDLYETPQHNMSVPAYEIPQFSVPNIFTPTMGAYEHAPTSIPSASLGCTNIPFRPNLSATIKPSSVNERLNRHRFSNLGSQFSVDSKFENQENPYVPLLRKSVNNYTTSNLPLSTLEQPFLGDNNDFSNTTSPFEPEKLFWSSKIGKSLLNTQNKSHQPTSDIYTEKVVIGYPEDILQLLKTGTTVEISCAASLSYIWCRLVNSDSRKKFQDMIFEMGTEYNNSIHRVHELRIGGDYVAKINSNWYRVRILSTSERHCICFRMDRGDQHQVQQNHVQKLLKKYADIPSQAFQCRLAGLESLNYATSKRVVSGLNQLRCFAILKHTGIDVPNIFPIELFDKNAVGNTPVNINNMIFNDILKASVITALIPDETYDCFIKHAERSGDLYIQICSEGLTKFNYLMEEFNEETPVESPKQDELYIIKNQKERKYERCKYVREETSSEFVKLYFIDNGRHEIHKLSNITFYPIKSKEVKAFPPFAIKVRVDINQSQLPDNFVQRIKVFENFDANHEKKIRFLRYEQIDYGTIGICEIFISKPNGARIYLRNILVNSLQKTNEEAEEVKTLPPSQIPEKNEIIDIRVTHTVNPSKFYAQTHAAYEKFTEMMNKLKNKYNNRTGNYQIKTARVGGIYAIKYGDEFFFYRAQVNSVFQNTVNVFLIDLGYETSVSFEKLLKLDSEFFEYPALAFEMKLAEVKPKLNETWTDTVVKYFKNLVTNNHYVCSVEKVEITPNKFITEIKMYDTTHENDIDIAKQLMINNATDVLNV